MSTLVIGILIGIAILAVILYNFSYLKGVQNRSVEDYQTTKAYDLKPLTRHPHIDHSICILCGSCIRACPETHGDDSPLGIVNGRLLLVNPMKCIGHALCELECPTGAMTVSLGELQDDPNMPLLSEEKESVIPNMFIAGELSGVPLVKNAVEQGEKVVLTITNRIKNMKTPIPEVEGEKVLDLAVIGVGPAGLSATLAAHEQGLNYVTLEQGTPGGTVANYPKQKLILTSPMKLPMYGMLNKSEIFKEELMEIWESLIQKYQLKIETGQKVTDIKKTGDYFTIQTDSGKFYSYAVVLSLGRRGTARKLGVDGEDQTKVTYGLIDPGVYEDKDILVVGGGDSAIEAAVVLSENNRVSLSYRKDKFFRVKKKNVDKIEKYTKDGKINLMLNSEVEKIGKHDLLINHNGEKKELKNDFVFILIGGEPPFPLLRTAGVLKEPAKNETN